MDDRKTVLVQSPVNKARRRRLMYTKRSTAPGGRCTDPLPEEFIMPINPKTLMLAAKAAVLAYKVYKKLSK